MNGKKAKKLRKLVYRDNDFRKREYEDVISKTINYVDDNGKVLFTDKKITTKADKKRRIYQYLKKVNYKSVPEPIRAIIER